MQYIDGTENRGGNAVVGDKVRLKQYNGDTSFLCCNRIG